MSKHKFVCVTCKTQMTPKTKTPGTFLVELGLWFFFILPGLIYSLWRISARKKVCSQCENPHFVKLGSEAGTRMLRAGES